MLNLITEVLTSALHLVTPLVAGKKYDGTNGDGDNNRDNVTGK